VAHLVIVGLGGLWLEDIMMVVVAELLHHSLTERRKYNMRLFSTLG